ncbi:thiamine pyrophosphate-binding protein [Streptomyces sp. NBC_00726]|uniref:thiamine pyrophosphate-binding protein n=1 Tax=Streptomyces sp. NBC_00726 TaxID=2903674 RepID=UPI00386C955F
MTTAVSFLFDVLEDLDVGHVFGVPGQAIMSIYNELHDRGHPEAVLCAHETGAAFAATGWAQVRGTVGVCCATTGPGALNLMTGVATAYSEGIPLLVLTGQSPLGAFGTRAYQESTSFARGVDTVAAFAPVTKSSSLAVSGDHLVRLLVSGLALARDGRAGPVHISVPRDLWDQPLTLPHLDRLRARVVEDRRLPSPSAGELHALEQELADANAPVILAGRGVASARAGDEVVRFAQARNIPIVTTVRGKGALPATVPLVLGHVGAGEDPALPAWWARTQPDLVLAVGTSLSGMSLGGLAGLPAPGRVISVNVDTEETGILWPADKVLPGDAAAVFGTLAESAEKTTAPPLRTELLPRTPQPDAAGSDASYDEHMHPGEALAAVRDALPAEARVLPDSGSHWIWSMRIFRAAYSNAILPGRSLGGMGQGIAAAIGAKAADPDRPVVSVTGDGSFLMHGGEVATAVNHHIPVLWVVVNDAALGRIRSAQIQDFDGRIISTEFHEMDFAEVAAGLGLWSRRVEKLDEIPAAVHDALASGRPALLDLRVRRADPPLGG